MKKVTKKTKINPMRSLKNRDLEGTNIQTFKSNGETYYYYTMPDKSREPLGKDRKKAIEAAIILNKHLRGSGELANKIIRKNKQIGTPIRNIIEEFIKEFLPEQNYSQQTFDGKLQKLNIYKKHWQDHTINSITVREIARFLKQYPPNSYMKHRSLLSDLFSFAINQGETEQNPVLVTMKKKAPKRIRKRHTDEGIKKIYDISPEWLQRAIDIAILTLQRRSDLVGIHRNHINLKEQTIKILQDKTRNYPKPVYIEIIMGEDLQKAVLKCIKSNIPCPYLLHYRPKQITNQIKKGKPHQFSITADYLTKEFAKYRDKSGAYDHLKPGEKPSFNDLRPYGVSKYEKAGYSDKYIMALTGHTTIKMLEHYKEGHGEQQPILVHADLKK